MNSLVLASLSLPNLVSRLPGGVAQGIIWGIMALGVYITFRLLDVADLTVDGSFTTGGAVTVMLIIAGWPAWARCWPPWRGPACGSRDRPAAHEARHPGHSRRHPDAVCALLDQSAHYEHEGQHPRQPG
ncbi:MAG: hypothetical protein ACLUMN_07940 [Oscillospiraceae bacterium]